MRDHRAVAFMAHLPCSSSGLDPARPHHHRMRFVVDGSERPAPARVEFEVPGRQRLADALIGPLLVCVIVLSALSIERPSLGITLAAVGGIVAFTSLELILAYSLTPFSWRLVLDAHSVWIGWGTHGRSLPYESVRFVRAVEEKGGWFAPFSSRGRLTIQTGHRTYVVKLCPRDAHAALKALQARCATTAGVDIDGQSFVASDARHVSSSLRRLRRFWFWRPVFGLCASAIGLAIGGCLLLLPGAEPPLTKLGWVFLLGSLIGAGAALLSHARGHEILARLEPKPGRRAHER